MHKIFVFFPESFEENVVFDGAIVRSEMLC
jgi:hypothetical protein